MASSDPVLAPPVVAMTEAVASAPNRFQTGLVRGFKRKCPDCGIGHLFEGYLKVRSRCEVCAHDNSQYRADDGPAYFTILIVGHVVIAPLFAMSIFGSWSPVWLLIVGLPAVAAATLAALPFIKGGWIGVLWATSAGPPALVP